MIVTVKQEITTFIVSKIPDLVGKVTTTYPSRDRFAPPSCVLDVTTTNSSLSLNKVEMAYGLVRVTVISDSPMQVDQLISNIRKYCLRSRNDSTLPTVKIFRSSNATPLIPAFEEEDEVWRRDVDLTVGWIDTT